MPTGQCWWVVAGTRDKKSQDKIVGRTLLTSRRPRCFSFFGLRSSHRACYLTPFIQFIFPKSFNVPVDYVLFFAIRECTPSGSASWSVDRAKPSSMKRFTIRDGLVRQLGGETRSRHRDGLVIIFVLRIHKKRFCKACDFSVEFHRGPADELGKLVASSRGVQFSACSLLLTSVFSQTATCGGIPFCFSAHIFVNARTSRKPSSSDVSGFPSCWKCRFSLFFGLSSELLARSLSPRFCRDRCANDGVQRRAIINSVF